MAPSEKKALRRLAKLGASNFETADHIQSRQNDLLRRLEHAIRA